MKETDLSLIVTRVRDQARLTRSFDLRIQDRQGERLQFAPGQVAVLRVGDQHPAYFAFSSAPEDPDLEVLVKRKAGASQVIYDLQPGDTIHLAGIAGHG